MYVSADSVGPTQHSLFPIGAFYDCDCHCCELSMVWMRPVFVLGSCSILPLQSAPLITVFVPIDAVYDCDCHCCQLSMVRIWVVFFAVPDLHIRSLSISVIGLSPGVCAPANAFYLALWLCDDSRHLMSFFCCLCRLSDIIVWSSMPIS